METVAIGNRNPRPVECGRFRRRLCGTLTLARNYNAKLESSVPIMPPKPLVFLYGDRSLPFQMTKVDRSKLYGYKELEVEDDRGKHCELATLSGDGQTVIGRGGTASAYLSIDGLWCDRSELKPVDLEGREMEPVASSFSQPPELLERASIEEYFQHNIRIVYMMTALDDADPLLAELQEGVIYTFPFSYRGGLVADRGFLLMAADGNVFMTIGTRVEPQFVGLQQIAVPEEDEVEGADDQDAMDFDMI